MKRFVCFYIIAVIFGFGFPSPRANAQVPQLINYQGRVVVGTENFDGTGYFKFAFVNATGTVSYWTNDATHFDGTEPDSSVTLAVTKGLYSVLLGDATMTNLTANPSSIMRVIPAAVFTNADVRLRVWFNDGLHGFQLFVPDQRIAAVGCQTTLISPYTRHNGYDMYDLGDASGSGISNAASPENHVAVFNWISDTDAQAARDAGRTSKRSKGKGKGRR